MKKYKNLDSMAYGFVMLVLLAYLFTPLSLQGVVFDDNVSAEINNVDPLDNPPLAQSCGLDIVLVMDESQSIGAGQFTQMQNAFVGFVNAFLPATPTRIGLVDFGTLAHPRTNFTNDVNALTTLINDPQLQGATNWEQALIEAGNYFASGLNRVNKPDLVIFASDGKPNVTGVTGQRDFQALDKAITAANALKAAGIRIITIGIGTGVAVSNLEAISSADAVITTDFSDLADDLALLASELCGGTITVKKIIDEDGDLGTTDDQTNGGGWTFELKNLVNGTADPMIQTTDSSGEALFEINLDEGPAMVDVQEQLKSDHILIGATCTGATVDGTFDNVDSVDGIEVGPDDIINCTFYNTPIQEETATITVIKIIDLDGDPDTLGDQTRAENWTFELENLQGGTANALVQTTDAMGEVVFEITLTNGTATVDVTEHEQIGYVIRKKSCQGPPVTFDRNSILGIALEPDDHIICTFYNSPVPLTATVTVRKVLDLDGDLQTTADQISGGPNWTYEVNANSQSQVDATDGSGEASFEIDLIDGVANVDVIEYVPPGYSLLNAICVGATGNGYFNYSDRIYSIFLNRDESILCTFYNSPIIEPELTLTKENDKLNNQCKANEGINYDICYAFSGSPYIPIVDSVSISETQLYVQMLHNVTIVDNLPPNVTFVSASFPGVYDAGQHTVTWDLGDVPSGTDQCVSLSVHVPAGTPHLTLITNTATIYSNELDPVSDNDTCVVIGEPVDEPAPPPPPVFHDLTVIIIGEGGTADPIGVNTFLADDVDLLAIPAPGYRVKAWTGTRFDSRIINENVVVLDDDKTVTLEFEPIPVVLNYNQIGTGGVIPATSGTYVIGTEVPLTSTPDPGYEVRRWINSDNDETTGTNNAVTLDESKDVFVEFQPTPVILTLHMIGSGGVLPMASGIINQNTVQPLFVRLAPDFRVRSWQGTDDDTNRTPYNQVTMTSDKTVTVAIAAVNTPKKFKNKKSKLQFTGAKFRVTPEQIEAADFIDVTIQGETDTLFAGSIPFSIDDLKKGKIFTYKSKGQGIVNFKFNLQKNMYSFTANGVTLPGDGPFYVDIEIGDYVGVAEIAPPPAEENP
jgi:von Willebrand factor type A domain-containing protein/uncharacterized protein DUF11/List-Bact-rpt repeat protein